eukprot:Blabericola_migrator_1__4560@NODE_2426_length_2782_cov_458_464825_g1519_i0_p2_GENE_NODE_2426_length_2782_cov_458_464825_g1519_i0NODE_2426_length_2782_cov_458_464825_g1519_i0_p2_ORF_typecomplete_len264_score43_31Integrin_beta/PF00362_18/5_7e32VWA/PF00092_28/2e06VWA_2/PF13519_6/0_03_NODE_2426_length_2782_cov_458_464825_g1519_i08401631
MRAFVPALATSGFSLAAAACSDLVDIMFLQDTTQTFDDDLPNIADQLSDISSAIKSKHPDARLGVAEYRDKPYHPYGESEDFCYRLNCGALTSDPLTFEAAYRALVPSGGADYPEDSYQAIINVILDSRVGWRPEASKIVVLVTDATVHQAGDWRKYSADDYPSLIVNLPPNQGGQIQDFEEECKALDYPTWQQVREVVLENEITLLITTPNEDPQVTATWRWINDDMLGQPRDFYVYGAADSSDFTSAVDRLLNAYEAECNV